MSDPCQGCEYRPELCYDALYQIWVRAAGEGTMQVGMTDIAQTQAGRILHVRVRKPGSLRPAGKPVATIETGKWAGPVPNPFDCEILAANEAVLECPELINAAPYEHWIAQVRPALPAAAALAGLVGGEAGRAGFCARAQALGLRCTRVDRNISGS